MLFLFDECVMIDNLINYSSIKYQYWLELCVICAFLKCKYLTEAVIHVQGIDMFEKRSKCVQRLRL